MDKNKFTKYCVQSKKVPFRISHALMWIDPTPAGWESFPVY